MENNKNKNNYRHNGKNDKKALILCIVISVAVIIVMFALIIDTSKKNNSDTGNGSTEVNYNVEQVEQAVVDKEQLKIYNECLSEGGIIAGINNISDYVTLVPLDELTVNTKDFPKVVEHGQIIFRENYVMGDFLLENVVYNSEVGKYDAYYNNVNEIIKFILEHDYKQYSYYYAQADRKTWDSIYDFLKVNKNQYEYFVDANTRWQYKYYMVVEALRQELNISVNEADMIKYLIETDTSVKDETAARIKIKQLGSNYIAQHAAAWKIKYALLEKADKKDASREDNLKDYKSYFSNIFYDNGKLKEIGETKTYIKLPENLSDLLKEEWNKDTYNKIYSGMEIVGENDSLNKFITEIPDEVVKDTGINKENYFKEQLVIQILVDKMELIPDNYEYDYLVSNGLDNEDKNEIIYKYGKPYFTRELMKYAVFREFGIDAE
ncbi:MAG: hypothetical protein PUB67_05665 [Clostridiales bacterium]|nr:hypothetical protein [Clostridiales bacterium]